MEDVAIVGVGQSNFSRACGISIKELAFEAFKEAMDGLNIGNTEIEASIVCSSMYHPQRSPENPISESLKLTPRPT